MKKTLLTLPQDILKTVQKLSAAPTKSKAVIIALEEYVRDKRLNCLLDRMGKGYGLTLKQMLHARKKG
ncbi:MAG: hypothetical protein HY877_07540 [Deltaproteobacteria bacterium]|nr:hypothetical protein [Deltaproteobacteria bacterium]